MKTEINRLLQSKNAMMTLSPISTLHRYQEDALGSPVDRLVLDVTIEGGYYSKSVLISSRTWREIVSECAEKQTAIAAEIINDINRHMVNGYGITAASVMDA